MQIRRARERGYADHGWLQTHHTFSFADYQDPKHMGFRGLRVINEDYVAPGKGFGTHPHRDMEIITYVIAGALSHRDSLGTGSTIKPGEVQRMSAGTGILHSEFNASETEQVHLLQIWILPDTNGHTPSYEQKSFPLSERTGQFVLVASPDGQDGSLTIHQQARMYVGKLDPKQSLQHQLDGGRAAWLHVVSGEVQVGTATLAAGDAISMEAETANQLTISSSDGPSEVLLFDLP